MDYRIACAGHEVCPRYKLCALCNKLVVGGGDDVIASYRRIRYRLAQCETLAVQQIAIVVRRISEEITPMR